MGDRKMGAGRMLLLLLATTAVSCTVGCVGYKDPPPKKYGVAFNAQRKKLVDGEITLEMADEILESCGLSRTEPNDE